MVDEANKELRRIRIALVFIAIFILFSAGERTITVDHNSDSDHSDQLDLSLSNMVQLGDGYFGVLSSETSYSSKRLKIYFYDKEKNKLTFIQEKDLDEDEELSNEE